MKETVIYAGSSEFGDYTVSETTYEGRPARVLFGKGHSGQSGLALDDDPELLFDYNQRFLEIAESKKPARVLLIGGGAFTFPKALLERFPKMRVDVVEIDPLLHDLAKRYFDLPDDKRLRVFYGDGRKYLEETKDKYDLIVLDAFAGYTIPSKLISIEATRYLKSHLKRGGAVAINFIAAYRSFRQTLTHRLLKTFGTRFSLVEIYPADPGFWVGSEQNLLLLASDNERHDFDYLRSAPVNTTVPPDGNSLITDETASLE